MKHLSITAIVASLCAAPALATEEINLLTWCDHTDRELLEPFEKANDVQVNVKVYELTGAAISLLDQSRHRTTEAGSCGPSDGRCCWCWTAPPG